MNSKKRFGSLKKRVLQCAVAAFLLCMGVFTFAGAMAEATSSGTWGTCPWECVPKTDTQTGGLSVLILGEEGKTTKGANTDGVSPWADLDEFVVEVKALGEVILPEDCSWLFNTNCMNETHIDYWKLNPGGLNTSGVKNMSHMLPMGDISSVTLEAVASWNTTNVTDMSYLFSAKASYRTPTYIAGELVNGMQLDLSEWNTSKVTNMSHMFEGFSNLEELDLSGWDTGKVTDTTCMFYDCTSLKEMNVSSWNTSNVTKMAGMFDVCLNLKSLDLSGWNVSNVTDFSFVFKDCWKLENLDLSGWDTSGALDMQDMFWECDALTTVKVGAKFYFKKNAYETLPEFPEGYWRSQADGKIYTPEQIAQDRSGIADTYTRLEVPEDGGFYLLTKGDNEYKIESFSYRNGSLIPVAAVPQEDESTKPTAQYHSAMKLKLNTVLLETGEVKLILPEGFSFNYNEVVTEKTCNVIPGVDVVETIYAFSLASRPPTLVFSVEGVAEQQIIIPVKEYGNQKKIRSETGIFDVEISASPGYWWDMQFKGFDEDKCWLADVLSFTVYKNEEAPIEALQNIGFVDTKTVLINDEDEDIHQLACYFGVRTVVNRGEVRHIVCMLNSGNYHAAQWLSDFMFDTLENIYTGDEDLGFEHGRHQGFDRMALRLESELLQYCNGNGIQPRRSALFTTGHSRAAAAASMIVHDAHWADYPGLNDFKDAVAYTFACPNTTKKLTDTWAFDDPNIHNIIYINDIVAFVPSWSLYHKYGNTYAFGKIGELNNALMTLIMFYAQGGMTLLEGGWQIGAMFEKHVVIPIAEAVRDELKDYLDSLSLGSRSVFDLPIIREIWEGHAHAAYLHRDICKPHVLDYSGAHAAWSALALTQFESVLNELAKSLAYDGVKYVGKKAEEVVYDTFSEVYACEMWLWDRVKDVTHSFPKSFLLFGCPVDITLKATDGTVIARFVDHELKEVDPLYVTAVGNGESSLIIIRDNIDYTAEITGTDIGTMDIKAVTLSENNNIVATYEKESVAVHIGEEYLLKAENALDVSDLTLEATVQVVAQGRLENGFLWTLYDSGRLSIDGTGAMPDFSEDALPAYHEHTADVKNVEFGPGVTVIGANALRGFEALEKVLIPGSVTKVSEGAFAGCDSLTEASYGAGAVKFRREPIDFCDNANLKNATWDYDNTNVIQEIEGLRRIDLPKETRTVGDGAFTDTSAEVIYVNEKCTSIGSGAFADNEKLICVIAPKTVAVPEDAFGDEDVILIGY